MKKFNFILVFLLLIIFLVILLIAQNNTPIELTFITWKFNTTVGLFGIIMLISGVVLVWIIFNVTHYREVHNLKNQIQDKNQIIKQLQEEIKTLKEETTLPTEKQI